MSKNPRFYVFDTGPFIIMFRYYYRSIFPSFWSELERLIDARLITSTREVKRELERGEDEAENWCKQNRSLFVTPSNQELNFVAEIFKVPHFQNLMSRKDRNSKNPIADPFVIARSKCLNNSCVVTTERLKPNASRIPNICSYFDIECINLKQFMEFEKLKF